jgi:hypothetical protein
MLKQQIQKNRLGNQLVAYRPIFMMLVALVVMLGIVGFSEPIPTIRVTAVEPGKSITFVTENYPANQVFTVTMGAFGSKGIGGSVAGSFNSGAGGAMSFSMPIPAEVSNLDRIAIRAQTSHLYPYYSYAWFFNQTAGNTPPPVTQPPTNQPGPATGYSGIPTIAITAVQRDKSVTFLTHNYPANQVFTVTMGAFGSKGIGGLVAGTFSSGAGGSMPVTMPIPAQLAGLDQIAIRAQTAHQYPFYSYNWFFNTTTQ